MRVYKAAGGALVRAQRMEQTISPTLHGRTRTTALRGNICMYVCEREVTATAGMAGVTYVTFASVVGVRLCECASLTPTRTYVRLQTASVQRIFRRRVVGPGRIQRVARSLNPPDPSVPFRPPPPPSLHPAWGRRRKLLLCSTFAGNDSATRMRPSLFPFILVPVLGER